MEKKSFLRFDKVTKSYIDGSNKTRTVLDQVSASFTEGRIIAVLGKSGSGKSTLLNLISGIDNVTSGSIFFNGFEITKLSDRQLTELRRNDIGFIFQFFNLLPSLTVWENTILPLELKNLLTKDDLHRAESYLSEVGMIDRRDEYPDKLSGGEQQRVAIARAIVHQPKIILADEPTGNLDERNGQIVMDLLSKLAKENNQNMVLVTHNRDYLKYADQTFSLVDGKLVDCI
jgi:putative ABC transport system ATP-binding protein